MRPTATVILLSLAPAASADQVLNIPLPDGSSRRAILHLPANPSGAPLPLVLGFHGGTGNAESFRSLTNFDATADANNFAVAYLDAGDGIWGDYRPPTGPPDQDLTYVNTTLDLLTQQFNIDPARVYATGISNGASFSFVLAASIPHRIAAIAPVGHNLSVDFVANARPTRPMHILQIVGTADPLMPFAGGPQPSGDIVLSSAETLEYWRNINHNPATFTTTPFPNASVDGTISYREQFLPARDGTELGRVVVVNGGHTWPGGLQYLPESAIGLTSRDFSASNLIWSFFSTKSVAIPEPATLALLMVPTLLLARRR